MKQHRIFMGVVSATLALGTLSSTAFAATSSSSTTTTAKYQLAQKAIYFNGKLVSKPYGFVVGQTTYMPIWYVMHTLDAMGITNQWTDGTTWKITTPKGAPVDMTKVTVGTGTITIFINGTPVQKVNGIAYTDPSTGKPTTYMPVWYVMQILNRLQITTKWDGKTWQLKGTSPDTSGGTGTGTGGTGGTGTGDGSGTTTPPAPQDTSPQAAQIPGLVSKAQLVADVANELKLTATPSATSPFDDLAATDTTYAPIEAAVQDSLVTPFSVTHFGSGDVVTLADAEKLYWNYLGIQYPTYEPGATMAQWGVLSGLTQGVSSSQYMTLSDEQQFLQNLAGLLAGQISNGQSISLRYTPQNEYSWTFQGDVTASGVPIYSTGTSIQQAITKTYAFYNAITVQLSGDSMLVTIPVDSDKRWFAYARSQDGLQYSTNGGASWTSAGSFDGMTVQANGTVILKAPLADGMSITYNNMVSQVAGSVSLGWVNLSQSATGGLTVERVTMN